MAAVTNDVLPDDSIRWAYESPGRIFGQTIARYTLAPWGVPNGRLKLPPMAEVYARANALFDEGEFVGLSELRPADVSVRHADQWLGASLPSHVEVFFAAGLSQQPKTTLLDWLKVNSDVVPPPN